MIVRLLTVLAVAAVLAVPGSAAGPGSYAGTIVFDGAEPLGIGLVVAGSKVTVSLGPGHVAHAQVAFHRSADGALRFAVPGLPSPIAFVLRAKGTKLTGTATQGSAHAVVTLTRGRMSADAILGYYSTPHIEIARFTRYGFNLKPLAIDMDTGVFTAPPPRVTTRLDVRQYEVRIPAEGAVLAGTLTVPPGPGPHPAAVYVTGSGATLREESHYLDSLFIAHGFAVLAYDKRGVGQSSGRYPGSLASTDTIDQLSGDAAAAARFLAKQPGIDPKHVGFYGISQGGWIMPQAAVRARGAVSWAVIQSGPTVTQGESDSYANLIATSKSLADAEAQARALGPSGYDPAPWIKRLAIPVLWLYGGRDHNQPAQHSMEILRSLTGHDFQIAYFPAAPHPLFTYQGFPAALYPTVADWLTAHGLP